MAKSTSLRVKNNTGSTIAANKLVYVTGKDETDLVPTIAIASNTSESKMPAVGITREEITNGELGEVRVSGVVSGFDTKGHSPNSPIYAGKNGAITFDNPTSGTSQKMGLVVNEAVEPDGQIFLFPLDITVKHASSHELDGNDEIDHDDLKGLDNDSHKIYSLVNGSRAFSGVVEGVYPTQPSHLVTKQYVDGLGQVVSTTFNSAGDGYLAFFVDNRNIAGDNDLYWDRVNNRLGIGTASPLRKLDIKQSEDTVNDGLGILNAVGNSRLNLFKIDATSYVYSGSSGESPLVLNGIGNVGIGVSPAISAILELSSTTGALLVSRMTTGERDALTAVDGMIIYNTTTAAFNKRQAGVWVAF